MLWITVGFDGVAIPCQVWRFFVLLKIVGGSHNSREYEEIVYES